MSAKESKSLYQIKREALMQAACKIIAGHEQQEGFIMKIIRNIIIGALCVVLAIALVILITAWL